MHFLIQHYISSVLISLKYIKIFNGTPTCFDLKRSSCCDLCGAMRWTVFNAWHHKGHKTHLLQYCCHNTGFNHRDFKFSVLNLKKLFKSFK